MPRYDPYNKKFTKEYYDHNQMQTIRKTCISQAKSSSTVGVIMGTLGRQGNQRVVQHLQRRLQESGRKAVVILLSEIFPAKLDLFSDLDAFVQIACPRLSIDWGEAFGKPLLTPYELSVVLGDGRWTADDENGSYPMDFYATESLGCWTPNHKVVKDSLKKCCGKCAD